MNVGSVDVVGINVGRKLEDGWDEDAKDGIAEGFSDGQMLKDGLVLGTRLG